MSNASIRHRVAAEFIGTAFLVSTIVGSGVMASRLSDDVGLQLFVNSIATGTALIALITALQSVSASFNPVVSLVSAIEHSTPWNEVSRIVSAQIAGGISGAILANLMFDLPAIEISTQERNGVGLWIAEVAATAGLIVVILGSLRSRRHGSLAVTVGSYITAAYWFTSSTSFANPAVSIARMFSDTFAGIVPADVPMFIAAQVIGGAIGLAAVRSIFGRHQPHDRIDV